MAILKETIINGNAVINGILTISNNDTSINVGSEIQSIWNTIYTLQATVAKTPQWGHSERLWAGTANAGDTITVNADWLRYVLFMGRTSDGVTMCIGCRDKTDEGNWGNTIRLVGRLDTGSATYLMGAALAVSNASTNQFKVVSCSRHTMNKDNMAGTKLQFKALYGLM